MDEAGWTARRAAAKAAQRYSQPIRNEDGTFTPVEEEPMPMNMGGAFQQQPWPHQKVKARGPPPLPPKDKPSKFTPPLGPDGKPIVIPEGREYKRSFDTSHSQAPPTAVERSRMHPSIPRMDPHLQFMAGPLLRFDTIENGDTWLGACMIVTADSGSVYEPAPFLNIQWDPSARTPVNSVVNGSRISHSSNATGNGAKESPSAPEGLAPHPSDAFPSVLAPISGSNFNGVTGLQGHSSVHQNLRVVGQEIWFYEGRSTSFTFWRFMIRIPLSDQDMTIQYQVNNGLPMDFHVPGKDQDMRVAAYSCNGFSAGVNSDDFRGPGFSSGYDPVWMDLLEQHSTSPFHVLVGGGDQLYCDSIVREPELQGWVTHKDAFHKQEHEVTDELRTAVDRFYFSHYCTSFRAGAFARANSSIPMLNMLDDHDLIDGFGSYPDALQMAPVFKHIGSRGYFFFLLFQCFVVVDVDGINPEPKSHIFKSTIIGGPGPYVPFPSHSVLSMLGPRLAMLLLDCRAERKREQVCSNEEYERVFKQILALPDGVEHLVIQIGIPIAYPRMNFLESALSSRMNPLLALSRAGTFAKGMVNKFNADAELLDDLSDHWTAKGHKSERNWFIEQMQTVAKSKRMRVTFLSGDVHCAAVGQFMTLSKGKNAPAPPSQNDHRHMLNIIASAIVNTPPPNAVLTMVGMLATKQHKSMHRVETDEVMVPIFNKDTDGGAPKSKYIMGRRNYCIMEHDPTTGDLVCDIRVEIQKGRGKTTSYPIRAPPPIWEGGNVPEM
ncbi:hypothetical protein BKA62DRAFT_683171 [Auriculariales sp. MPI-PUGE-AT-0066]|nr:hypothetical protein BKA62DRAFT_683171 [Auriculariales sp. MPI-PUGE-AT-0066]